MGSDALLGRASGMLRSGEPAGAAEIARAALATEDEPARAIRLMMLLTDALIEMGDAPGARNVLAQAEAMVGIEAGATAAEIARRHARALLLGQRRLRAVIDPVRQTEALSWADRLVSMGPPGGDAAWQVEGDLYRALTYAMAGQTVRAKPNALRCARTARGLLSRVSPDLVALLALTWWLIGEPGEAVLAVERLGSDRSDERSMRAVGRFETGDVRGALLDASVAWDGMTPPRGVEALGGLLAWGSADPARATAAARAMAQSHRTALTVPLPVLTISLAARALFRAGQIAEAQALAREVAASVSDGWPRGEATLAYELLEDAEGLGWAEPGSIAALRRDRLDAAHDLDVDRLLATRRRFLNAGHPFEAAETLAMAGRLAFVRGDEGLGGRLLGDAERAYEQMGASVEAERTRADLVRLRRE
jgi:hypothetical protein